MPSKNREVKNATNTRYYQRNKERLRLKASKDSARYYQENTELCLERAKRSREKHYEKSLHRNIKSRCLKEGIPFNLHWTDIIIPELCPYLGIPLTRTQGKGKVWSNASVDRLVPDKGYIVGNIEVISNKANLMKAHATQEELLTFAKNVIARDPFFGK